MPIPAPPAQHALALAPVDIVSTTPSLTGAPLGRALDTTLRVRSAALNVLDGRSVSVAGTLSPASPVARSTCRRWVVAAGARSRRPTPARADVFACATGRDETGSERVRVRFPGEAGALPSHRRLGRLNVYRAVEASWYGGGGGLACGGSLTSSTMGVANKTLPCGTLVTLRYNGRSVRVPVVDRGPYVAGREFDLTEATKQALGFGSTGEVWSTR